jgi:hypothetical protein
MNRSRQLLMVAFVATALAADRAVASAPQDRPNRTETTTPNTARRLAGRLVVTFRRSVSCIPFRPFRQEGFKAQPQALPAFVLDAEPPPSQFAFGPFQYRLPPPLA